jgi:5-formyltetrahydrofolate cyclo-ligase
VDLKAAKKALRQNKRALRQGLSDNNQAEASLALLNRLQQTHTYTRSKSIALYLAADGEISPHLIAEAAWAAGKQVYLPVISPAKDNTMQFVCYEPDTILNTNHFGIAEPAPVAECCIDAKDLDLVLLPLVAFDRQGGRLGMGGGYYDRAFAFMKLKQEGSTELIGLAHHCQETESLTLADWDIHLNAVMTDLEYITI